MKNKNSRWGIMFGWLQVIIGISGTMLFLYLYSTYLYHYFRVEMKFYFHSHIITLGDLYSMSIVISPSVSILIAGLLSLRHGFLARIFNVFVLPLYLLVVSVHLLKNLLVIKQYTYVLVSFWLYIGFAVAGVLLFARLKVKG